MTEKNKGESLSEKITKCWDCGCGDNLMVEHVKEFVKRLKGKFVISNSGLFHRDEIYDAIDEIFGDKLI